MRLLLQEQSICPQRGIVKCVCKTFLISAVFFHLHDPIHKSIKNQFYIPTITLVASILLITKFKNESSH